MQGKKLSRSPLYGRSENLSRNLRQSFMIFTEGETEEGYFKQFKVRCKTVKGGNALKIVEESVIIKQQLKKRYDQYWVVFDKDNSSLDNFLNAIQLAERNNLHVAFSCDAFEVWWLFHFMLIRSRILPRDYSTKIKAQVKEYSDREKGIKQGAIMWLRLEPKMKMAIENAKKAHERFGEIKQCYAQSVTTVYKLVEMLSSQG